jgi:hypothetical protein
MMQRTLIAASMTPQREAVRLCRTARATVHCAMGQAMALEEKSKKQVALVLAVMD